MHSLFSTAYSEEKEEVEEVPFFVADPTVKTPPTHNALPTTAVALLSSGMHATVSLHFATVTTVP